MDFPTRFRKLVAALVAISAAGLIPIRDAGAEVADLAQVPLASSPSDSVLPNLMYMLDDSGSMAWNYMPDQVFRTSGGSTFYNCKKCTSSSCIGPGGSNSSNGWQCGNSSTDPDTSSNTQPTDYGEAPFYASGFNRIWYNPDITYAPGLDSTGTSLGNASLTNASDDAYLGGGNTNVVAGFQEVVYCNVSSPTAANLLDPTKCRKNGIHNVSPFLATAPNYFLYWGSASTNIGLPTTTFFNKVLIKTSNAHYYNIASHEFCSDANLVNCVLATAAGLSPGTPNTIEAPLRWCKTAADARLLTAVSGSAGTPAAPRCQKKFHQTNYTFPRYGRFTRVDIVPTTATYPQGPNALRTDCAAATTCTYAEEIQNFANWWTYYRTRMALMKTATGRAFLPIDDRFRIGFITINPNSPVTSDKYQPIAKFDAPQKGSWYTKLYQQQTNGSTPNRTALHRVGRHYQGQTDGINSGMSEDPIEYSCQQNFTLLTTDGYWNDTFSSIGNVDNVDGGYTTRGYGAYDGALSGASSTLADVSAYYYKTDLRPAMTNNVPTSTRDGNPAQHMVTFTLGLGLEGFMDYQTDYETSTTGDFAKIKAGSSNLCSWTTGTCNWPVPSANQPGTLDDLWHAAVNGRGKYFSASDPNSLTQGLQSALAALNIQTGAAAASATSSPNITETDNYLYSTTFRTVKWDGQVDAKRIDPISGVVLPSIVWSAQGLLDGRTTDTSDSRTIFTIDESAGGKKKPFNWASLTNAAVGPIAPEQSYFTTKCTAYAQCALLTVTQKAVANDGQKLVEYLRGWRENEAFSAPEITAPFRTREHVLGDPVNASPAFMAPPSLLFADAVTPTYASFQSANATRQTVLFVAANDGMLHALNGDTGQEMWAYVPRITMPKMHKLATENWTVTHEYTVDGSPQLMDAFIGGGWKTVIVGGLNAGGRGYYALDVTIPTNPTVLWEICSSPSVCVINDPDMGFTFGNPVITKRASDGRWVVLVTSGLNNVLPGDGKGYLYVLDLATGAILQKVGTGQGDTTTPSGFNKVAAYADNFAFDNTAKFVYGGDLLGNVWKFDLTVASPARTLLAQLRDAGGKPQSVTTRPELAAIKGFPVVFVGTGRYLGGDDLSNPATLTPPLAWAYDQSLYAIKDRSAALGNFRAGNVVQNTILIQNAVSRTTTSNLVDWATQDGWFIDFNPAGDSPGERVNVDPQLIRGTLVVFTNVPNSTVCAAGGDSWLYQLNYLSGAFIPSPPSSTGQPADWAGKKYTGKQIVGGTGITVGGGSAKIIVNFNKGDPPTEEIKEPPGGGTARRISWRELFQR